MKKQKLLTKNLGVPKELIEFGQKALYEAMLRREKKNEH